MARFEDTPGLFGVGVGSATFANITCDWCGEVYGGREDEQGEPNAEGLAMPLRNATFGGLTVVECCFEKVEAAVVARMPDVIPWYTRRVKRQQLTLDQQRDLLEKLSDELSTRH